MSSEFDAIATTKDLIRRAFHGALGTLEPEGGAPHVSLVTVATMPDGAPILLLSDLAVHTRNLRADPRVSLMVSQPMLPGDPLALARVSVAGRLTRLEDPSEARRRFLARQPEAAEYADFPDFGFYRLEPDEARLVAGFGRIVTLSAADFMTDVSDCADLLASEEGAVQHMNDDHADAVTLYATRLDGQREGHWRVSGLDPDGVDLVAGHRAARVGFPDRVTSPGALRSALKQLAERARTI
ncbi:HugZ family protein [Amorphus sp. 3PC139-8]|uniref:HugZ family pyridoxamine 5'-phosphate oxidase n=1 Tax=Amorphus sp. 3PC139-8 TaxID=2735676 RepID=UPI00345DBB17